MSFTTLQQWLDWQNQLHPKNIDLGLERVSAVKSALHLDQLAPVVITVAGTNGKGSVVRFLEEIYRAAGFQTGAYTSPHLLHYNERIQVNGIPVSDKVICETFKQIDALRKNISLTYFEFATLAAGHIFQQAELDVVILEVGLGGRLDAVNVFEPSLTIITSIGLDHTEWLGDDIESIAYEKLGISRANIPLVYGNLPPMNYIDNETQQRKTPLYKFGDVFSFNKTPESWTWENKDQKKFAALPLPKLFGERQLINASMALQAIHLLHDRLTVSTQHIRNGLCNTELAGRFQLLHERGKPALILDVAHNPDAAQVLADNLRKIPRPGQLHAVFGILNDKDLIGILEKIVPFVDYWHVVNLATERALPAQEIVAGLESLAVSSACISIHGSAAAALKVAEKNVDDRGGIVVFGSFYCVSEVIQKLA